MHIQVRSGQQAHIILYTKHTETVRLKEHLILNWLLTRIEVSNDLDNHAKTIIQDLSYHANSEDMFDTTYFQ